MLSRWMNWIATRQPVPSSVMACVTALFMATTVHGQCSPQWAAGPLAPPIPYVLDCDIRCFTNWDPDGAGPLGTYMIVGGEFDNIGGVPAKNVAAWDGWVWRSIGAGINQPVTDLTAWGQYLIAAGGTFINGSNVEMRDIALWNGHEWDSFGGVGDADRTNVTSVMVFNNTLVASLYVETEPVPASSVIQWTGSSWQPIGALQPAAWSLAIYNNQLHAGSSQGLQRWDGSTWVQNAASGGPTGQVREILTFGTGLYAIASSFAGFNERIRMWDGAAWHSLDGGINGPVNAMIGAAGGLLAGGNFSNAGGFPVDSVAIWSGAQWFPRGNPNGWPVAFGTLGNAVYTAGEFSHATNDANLLLWNDGEWETFGTPCFVTALSNFGGSRLVMGGHFTTPAVNSIGGPTSAYHLAAWDGARVTTFGAGVDAPVSALTSWTDSAAPFNKRLIVGGHFDVAGGLAASHVAMYTESSNIFQTGWSNLGSGFNSVPYALERGYQGVLIAGGAFTQTGAVPLGYMARWNGTQWAKFATAGGTDMNGTVRAIKVYTVSPLNPLSNVLTIAGGDFTTANGGAANRIAFWTDNPSTGSVGWTAMGAGFNNTVYAIERYGSSTYAAGAFTASGAFTMNRIARWNGTSWLAVGNGIGFNGPVYALKSIGGFLYATGDFFNVDGIPVQGIARWNGTAWSDVGGANGGIAGDGFALASFQTEAIVGGLFSNVFLPNSVSHGVGRILPGAATWIAQQPSPATTACGSDVSFAVQVPSGYSGLTYAWRRNTVPLTDGPTGSGATISGSGAAALAIAGVRQADAGSYDCVISNATCGTVSSTAAALAVLSCCPADIAPAGGNGVVNVDDLLAVINAWGACADPDACPADIVPSGGNDAVNVDDLLAVINGWGPCP